MNNNMDDSINNIKFIIDNNKIYKNIINKIIINDKLSIILPEIIETKDQNGAAINESLYISDDDEKSADNEDYDGTVNNKHYEKNEFNNEEPPNKKIKKNDQIECPGCYPVFQPNQIAHTGINGCLKCDYEY